MSPDEASKRLLSRIMVAREDIARAKGFIVAATETSTDALAEQWLRAETGTVPTLVDIQAAGADDTLALLARAYSLRLGFYQAVWELVAACEVLPGAPAGWQASATWQDAHGAGGLQLGSVNCLFPAAIGARAVDRSGCLSPGGKLREPPPRCSRSHHPESCLFSKRLVPSSNRHACGWRGGRVERVRHGGGHEAWKQQAADPAWRPICKPQPEGY